MDADADHGRRPGTHYGVASIGRVLVIRLGPGEDVLPAMEQILLDADCWRAMIVSGVASLEHASVRNIHAFPPEWPIRAEHRSATTIPGPLEILGMQGNVAPAPDGGLTIHCHVDFSVGTPATHTFGGHLIEDTIVGTTCELFVAELAGTDLRRTVDRVTRAPEITTGDRS